MKPPVSIVIPCYNKKDHVAAAIESALAQGDLAEVVVIDDGSTDGSLDEVRRYDGRIMWETGPNRGGAAARNRGLALASGDYIQFLDADDILPPGKLRAQLSAMRGGDSLDMAFCAWSYLDDDGSLSAYAPRRYWRSHQSGLDLLVEMWTFGGLLPLHAWLVTRKLIGATGPWNEALTADDDGEFFGRLLVNAGSIHFQPGTEVLYRRPREGFSVSRDRSPASVSSVVEAYFSVSRAILARRDDYASRRACLSRLRNTAYQFRYFDEVVKRAVPEERRLGLRDFSPSLPRRTRLLVGLLGLERALSLHKMLEAGRQGSKGGRAAAPL